MLSPAWTAIGPTLSYRVARELCIALAAQGIPYRLLRTNGGYRILVPHHQVPAAQAELAASLEETRKPSLAPPPAPASGHTLLVLAWLPILFLGGFGLMTSGLLVGPGHGRSAWIAAGSANATAICSGELWRVITALTLHADGAHLATNLLAGGLFTSIAAQRWGAGLTWFATLTAASLANLLVAWTFGPGHDSIGFSTAVFAAIGLTAWRRPLPPRTTVALGLAFLALLGMEGEQTDLGAHVAGLATGLGAGALLRHLPAPGPMANATLLLGATGLPLFAWALALR